MTTTVNITTQGELSSDKKKQGRRSLNTSTQSDTVVRVPSYVFGPIEKGLEQIKAELWSALVEVLGSDTPVLRWACTSGYFIIDASEMRCAPIALEIYTQDNIYEQTFIIRGNYRRVNSAPLSQSMPKSVHGLKLVRMRIWQVTATRSWVAIECADREKLIEAESCARLYDWLASILEERLETKRWLAPWGIMNFCAHHLDHTLELKRLECHPDPKVPNRIQVGPLLTWQSSLLLLLESFPEVAEDAKELWIRVVVFQSIKDFLDRELGNDTPVWVLSSASGDYYRLSCREDGNQLSIEGELYHQDEDPLHASPAQTELLAIIEVKHVGHMLVYLVLEHLQTTDSRNFCAFLLEFIRRKYSGIYPPEQRLVLEEANRHQETGLTEAGSAQGSDVDAQPQEQLTKGQKVTQLADFAFRLIEQDPDLPLQVIADRASQQLGRNVSRHNVYDALKTRHKVSIRQLRKAHDKTERANQPPK